MVSLGGRDIKSKGCFCRVCLFWGGWKQSPNNWERSRNSLKDCSTKLLEAMSSVHTQENPHRWKQNFPLLVGVSQVIHKGGMGCVNERKTGVPEYSGPFKTQEKSCLLLPFSFITSPQLVPKIGSLFLLLIKGNTSNASNDITQCIIRSDLHSQSQVTNRGAINERRNRKASGVSTRQSFYTFSCRVLSPTEL